MNKLLLIMLIVSTAFLSSCTLLNCNVKKDRGIEYPDRTFEQWDPELATKEAEDDIKNNKLKVYMHSDCYRSYLPGISTKEEEELVKTLPIANGGLEILRTDTEFKVFSTLKERQRIYSEKYNKRILKYLTKHL